jgi:hypothetical protein
MVVIGMFRVFVITKLLSIPKPVMTSISPGCKTQLPSVETSGRSLAYTPRTGPRAKRMVANVEYFIMSEQLLMLEYMKYVWFQNEAMQEGAKT